jgi:hypothetical protein
MELSRGRVQWRTLVLVVDLRVELPKRQLNTVIMNDKQGY